MGLKRAFWGLWMVVCDNCNRKFELDGTYMATPSKNNTIGYARYYGWRVGKRTLCPICKKEGK